MKLSEYLAAPRPSWDWVSLDCCRWVDKWVQERGHGSPMAAINIQYDSERSALRRIAEGGGLGPLWMEAMVELNIPAIPFLDALPGDVGVIDRPTVDGTNEAAAIWTGDRWVTLGLRGLDFGPAMPLAVWRV